MELYKMAKEQNQNIDTVALSKPGLVTDLNSSYISEQSYSFARNTVKNSKDGDIGTIGNEPSNIKCYSTPYDIIGIVPLPDGKDLVFSTDNTNSEIGIGDINNCTYSKYSNLKCLNFNKNFQIKGVAKKQADKGIVVTFTDKYNPMRRIELDKNFKSCDEILLFKNIQQPCINLNPGQVGTLPDGTYSVAIAYSINGKVFTDWLSISNRIQINNDKGSNSISIEIQNLDKNFDEYNIAVIGNYIDPDTKGATKLTKIIGTFSTSINRFELTDFINSNYIDIPTSDIINKKNTWEKAGIISSNSNYLLFGDLVKRKEENYQLKAMSIEIEYAVEQVAVDFYEQGGQDISYYRDENYAFFIEGVYRTGDVTSKFHIPGPLKTAKDAELVNNADVYEYDKQFQCDENKKIEKWMVENTAGKLIRLNNKFSCNRRILGYGKMGYFQSEYLYPNNTEMFGDNVNTPIRYPKFPDESIIPRYEVIDEKTYINILGVRFKNIPSFDNPDIVGYRITRTDRSGGNATIVARGLMTNVRWYQDKQLDQKVMYTNYTVNDLRVDKYLSSTQTSFKGGKELNFTPLSEYYKDRFNFYSPHTMFEPRYTLGTEIKIEAQEVAEVTGKFNMVHDHPKQKLLNQFAFWISAAVGSLSASLILLGKTDIANTTKREVTTGMNAGVTQSWDTNIGLNIENVNDLIGLSVSEIIDTVLHAVKSGKPGIGRILRTMRAVFNALLAVGLKVPYSILFGIMEADRTLDTIYKFTGFTDYVYQYDAVANFNKSFPVIKGQKRRRVLTPIKYIPSDVVSIDGDIYNNYFREKTTYVHLNKELNNPKIPDNSRDTISGFGICENIDKEVKSTGSAFYVTSKVPNSNQYGELGSGTSVSMHSCLLNTVDTPILYGGDCIIGRFQFMKKMQFFNQNLANANYPDGIDYDYRMYRNIAYPRYWFDSTKYDFSKLLTKNVVNFTRFSRTTTGKYNLDCKKKNDGESISRIDNAYMYLSNNCVLDFIVEADYNFHFREKSKVPYYSKSNTNLKQIFRSDNLEKQEEFLLNRVYSDIYTVEVFNKQQRLDFTEATRIQEAQENSIIYSLASFNLQKVDNWQYFLPGNFFAFQESDFGKLTGIHKLDQDRLMFLFSKSSPYISMGRDFLELDGTGRKITIGDGGLFAQDPREIMPTDNNYAASTSKFAFSNTHLGRFFISEHQGRIINYTESLDDISRQGISYWCKNYMPINLYRYFPNYNKENPVYGVGYQTIFDSSYEIVYICKKDYVPKKEYLDDITFDGEFKYKGEVISLDSKYFNDVSWTLSYSPLDKAFVSWHDWHPDIVVQRDSHFSTVKGNTIWKHNEAFDSYCNFYGVDYPFEIEFVSSSGQNIHTVRSLEYLLEVYKYKNFGRDRFHVLNENFDRLIVRNSEQISPLLNLKLGNPNPEDNLLYPKINSKDKVSWDITFFKEENKYRINQFWDSVKDRGEFSKSEVHNFPTDESGYRSIINPIAIDVNKAEEERKKFRHYYNMFRLIKTISGANKFIVKLFNIKKQGSIK
jgi:hypothetical protein